MPCRILTPHSHIHELEQRLIKSFLNSRTQKNPDDVVITLAIRTPLTKARKGGFKDTGVDGMVVKLLKEVVKRMNTDPGVVEDICLGNVSSNRVTHFAQGC